jgi:hypothetical protein
MKMVTFLFGSYEFYVSHTFPWNSVKHSKEECGGEGKNPSELVYPWSYTSSQYIEVDWLCGDWN